MKSKAKFLVVLVVIVSLGLVLGACGSQTVPTPVPPTPVPPTPTPIPPTPTPGITVDDLIGVWKNTDFPSYLQFNEDGTYQVGYEPGGDSYESGRFQLDGALLTYIPDAERSCNKTGSYLVELTEQGQLYFELQEDECPTRANLQPGFLDPVEP